MSSAKRGRSNTRSSFMSVEIYETPDEVARVAANNAIETLTKAIESKGSAVWVLAGGTSPMLAYGLIKEKFADAIDWSKVTVLIGDERIVPLSDPDSNWGTIIPLIDDLKVQKIVPQPELGEVEASAAYAKAVQDLSFDLVWVGVGEDGHTLSLFPGNAAFVTATDAFVIPVYDSPKLPPTRMTLSLKAMEKTKKLIIFAVGEAKKAALMRAKIDKELPIAKVAATVEKASGEVKWLYDRAASGEKL
jgi:6-phosphogluconolactonase